MISDLEKQIAGLKHLTSPSTWDHSQRPNYVDLALNFNSVPYNSNAAIIVTAWYEQLPFMKATLTNYRLTGKFILCAYDQPFVAWGGETQVQHCLPTHDIWILPHAWVFKHITYDSAKRNGWFWDVRYAQGVLKQFDNFTHIFHVNGDCIWENPDGVDDLIKLLEDNDADFMTISRDNTTIHTCAVVYRAKAFHTLFDHMIEKYRHPIVGSRSPEKMLTQSIRELKLKEFIAPVQPLEPGTTQIDHYSRFAQDSTWKQLVGYRNLTSEHLDAIVEGRPPIDKKYVDVRFKRHMSTNEPILKYYETGDRRWLHKLWDMNETSWYNRVYYPIEYYGPEPIMTVEEDPWMLRFDNKNQVWVRDDGLPILQSVLDKVQRPTDPPPKPKIETTPEPKIDPTNPEKDNLKGANQWESLENV